MKREDHFAQLVVAALLGAIGAAIGAPGFAPRAIDEPEFLHFLVGDFLCGMSLLPIVACIRRGYTAAKVGALLLSVFPLTHIYLSVERNGRIFTSEWTTP